MSLLIFAFYLDVTPDTTADGAAGIFGLYLMGDTPTADQVHSNFKQTLDNFPHPNNDKFRRTRCKSSSNKEAVSY